MMSHQHPNDLDLSPPLAPGRVSWRAVGWTLAVSGALLVGFLLYAALVLLPAHAARQEAESRARLERVERVMEEQRARLQRRLEATEQQARRAVARAVALREAARRAAGPARPGRPAAARGVRGRRGPAWRRGRGRHGRHGGGAQRPGGSHGPAKPDPSLRNNPLRGLGQEP